MFCGLSLTQNQKEVHMFYLVREVWKICSCWEKGNFIMNGEFKYGQTWKIWPFPLSLSLCSAFYCQNQLNLTKVFLSVLPYTEKPQISEMLFVIPSLFLSNMNVIAKVIFLITFLTYLYAVHLYAKVFLYKVKENNE